MANTFTLLLDQQLPLTVEFTSASGAIAKVGNIPFWTTSDPAVLTVVAAADGMSAVATVTGIVGVATLSVSANADTSGGINVITGTLDVTVATALEQATTVTIIPGIPTTKPAPNALRSAPRR